MIFRYLVISLIFPPSKNFPNQENFLLKWKIKRKTSANWTKRKKKRKIEIFQITFSRYSFFQGSSANTFLTSNNLFCDILPYLYGSSNQKLEASNEKSFAEIGVRWKAFRHRNLKISKKEFKFIKSAGTQSITSLNIEYRKGW